MERRPSYLFVEQPETYSFDDLARSKRMAWTGRRQTVTQQSLGAIRRGDRILYGHIGDDRIVLIGIAKAARRAFQQPNGDRIVEIVPVKRLKRPVSLEELHWDRRFCRLLRVRLAPRSIVPLDDELFDTILTVSGTT